MFVHVTFLSFGSQIPISGTQGHMVFETLSICVPAAVPSQGELGGRKSSPPEPDPAVEPAEPDASRAEHGEQGAVPRGTEAVHVRGVGGACRQGSRLPGSTPRWETSGLLGTVVSWGQGTEHLASVSFSRFPCKGSRFLKVVAVGLCLRFKGIAHHQKLLNLLLELNLLLKIQQC